MEPYNLSLTGDFDHCHTLIENISQYFKLPNLYPSMPAIINQLPPQIQETINCGVFIAVFWFLTYIHTYLHSDAIKTMEWLERLLIQEKLWIDGQFLFENMLIPACIKNSHWILIHINVWNHTFSPINPYHSTEPHQGDFD